MASSKSSGGKTQVKDPTGREAGREKVRAMQDAQRRKERRQRSLIITAGAVVAAVLIGIVVVAVGSARSDQAARDDALTQVVEPTGVTDTGGIVAAGPSGAADQPVTVVEYLDYQCPACQQFDLQVGPYLKEQVAAGNVTMEYHPVNFLDRASSTRYSSRSANAAYCLADDGQGDIQTFSDALYAQQPPEGGEGLPDEVLVQAARDAGASEAVEQCIADETHTGYVTQQDEQAFAPEADGGVGIGGTPAVYVEGTKLETPSLEAVTAAIEEAQG